MDELICGVCGAAWTPGAAFCVRCTSSVAQAEPTVATALADEPSDDDDISPAAPDPLPSCPQCGEASPRGAQRCLSCFAPLSVPPAPPTGFAGAVAVSFPWGARRLHEGERMLVGRAYESEVVREVTPFPDVSRHHAELVVRDGALVVRDLGSTNGTYRNGTRLAPDVEAIVSSGDRLRFGQTLVATVAGEADR